jgi:hypothetical protein
MVQRTLAEAVIGQTGIGQSGYWPKQKLAKVDIGRSGHWLKQTLAEADIGQSRHWPKRPKLTLAKADIA